MSQAMDLLDEIALDVKAKYRSRVGLKYLNFLQYPQIILFDRQHNDVKIFMRIQDSKIQLIIKNITVQQEDLGDPNCIDTIKNALIIFFDYK